MWNKVKRMKVKLHTKLLALSLDYMSWVEWLMILLFGFLCLSPCIWASRSHRSMPWCSSHYRRSTVCRARQILLLIYLKDIKGFSFSILLKLPWNLYHKLCLNKIIIHCCMTIRRVILFVTFLHSCIIHSHIWQKKHSDKKRSWNVLHSDFISERVWRKEKASERSSVPRVAKTTLFFTEQNWISVITWIETQVSDLANNELKTETFPRKRKPRGASPNAEKWNGVSSRMLERFCSLFVSRWESSGYFALFQVSKWFEYRSPPFPFTPQ